MKKYPAYTLAIMLFFLYQCSDDPRNGMPRTEDSGPRPYQVAFLIMDGVYNTELTAPYDIFQHTQFREGIRPMHVFTVAKSKKPVTTFEGIRILPDFDYTRDRLPAIDILVVPSAEHHLDTDLEDEGMIRFVRATADSAAYVMSLCDGAVVLAKAGLLDNSASTTFPADIAKYRSMFPHLEVYEEVLFVHDGKFITSAGGAKSFEAALYLAEHLYGKDVTEQIAQGLVIDWDVDLVPRIIRNRD
jgi:transcriptional regulator GlxA family with amidase domain